MTNPSRGATPLPIRSATLPDLPAILCIEEQAPTASHWTANQYRSLIHQGVLLVAERANKICGFIAAQTLAGDWEIENVVVGKEYLRQGIASELVHEIMKRASVANAPQVILEVRESNHAARTLYEKMGFRQQGVRQGYYQDPPEAALLYSVGTLTASSQRSQPLS